MSNQVQGNTEEGGVGVVVEHAPARTSSFVAVISALLAIVSTTTGSILSTAIALLGFGGVAGGLFGVQSRRVTLVGTGTVFLGLVVSGVFGNPTPVLLFGAIATFVTFDVSQNAFRVGAQTSTDTETRRGELIHIAATVALGSLAVVATYGVYMVSTTGLPAPAVVFLLLCAVLFVWVIRS